MAFEHDRCGGNKLIFLDCGLQLEVLDAISASFVNKTDVIARVNLYDIKDYLSKIIFCSLL